MIPDLSERSSELEAMDTESLSPAELQETLGFLAWVNRAFGGCRSVTGWLDRWSLHWQPGETLHILDVGTGGGDIALAIRRWAEGRPFRVRVTGIDRAPEIAAFARRRARPFRDVTIQEADVFAWAAAGHTYDYVVSSLFLHHIPEVQVPALLGLCDRMARRGIVVSDLVRSRWAYAAAGLLSRAAGNRVVRNDGPLSVRRGFTREDLERYRSRAGLPYLEIRHHLGFRWTLAGEKGNLIRGPAALAEPRARVTLSPRLSSS